MRITIGIMSYDGHVAYGVTGDADKFPDLGMLCDGIDAATQELLSAAAVVGGAGRSPGEPTTQPAGFPGARHPLTG